MKRFLMIQKVLEQTNKMYEELDEKREINKEHWDHYTMGIRELALVDDNLKKHLILKLDDQIIASYCDDMLHINTRILQPKEADMLHEWIAYMSEETEVIKI